jgi:predicted S18 family serine protease
MTMHRGFIKIWRCIEDWEWIDDPLVFWFFCKLLLMANWEDKKWHGMTIKRGQFISSVESLRFKHGVGERKKRLTIMQVRTLIQRLKSTNEITSEATNKFTLYTIAKYELYQKKENETTNEITSEITNEQQTNNKRTTTTKELKELKNYKNIQLSKDSCTNAKSDEEKIEALKGLDAYAHINIDQEVQKAQTWIQARQGRKFTYRFFINWINRLERPMKTPKKEIPL